MTFSVHLFLFLSGNLYTDEILYQSFSSDLIDFFVKSEKLFVILRSVKME